MRQKFATLFIAISIFFGSLNIVFGNDLKKAIEAYKRGDFKTTVAYLKPLAEQGYKIAQNNLGVMYGRGLGVPKDYKMAFKWYAKAAEQGYANAQ